MPNQARRTIAVTARGHGRLSQLRLTYPDQADHPIYDAALARQLLTQTIEVPHNRRALLLMLTEYRHALRDLAMLPATPDDHAEPGEVPVIMAAR